MNAEKNIPIHNLIKGFRTASRYTLNGNNERAVELLETAIVRYVSEITGIERKDAGTMMLSNDEHINKILSQLIPTN